MELFAIVIIVVTAVFVFCVIHTEHHIKQHGRKYHDERVRQGKVASAWRERQMATDDIRGKHAYQDWAKHQAPVHEEKHAYH